jgi:hypothetical protein
MMPSASHSRARTSHLAQLVNTTILHNDCGVICWSRQNAENRSQSLRMVLDLVFIVMAESECFVAGKDDWVG